MDKSLVIEIAKISTRINFSSNNEDIYSMLRENLSPFIRPSKKIRPDEIVELHALPEKENSTLKIDSLLINEYIKMLYKRISPQKKKNLLNFGEKLSHLKNFLKYKDVYKKVSSALKKSLKNTIIYCQSRAGIVIYSPLVGIWHIYINSKEKKYILGFLINALYLIYAKGLSEKNGVLFHGTAIAKKGEGILFLGKSGAGKSTLTKLIKDADIYSDDGIIIRKHKNHFLLYNTPFRQFKDKACPLAPSRLKAVYFLKKDKEIKIEKKESYEFIPLVIPSLIHFLNYLDDKSACKIFNLCYALSKRVPIYRLSFKKEPLYFANLI